MMSSAKQSNTIIRTLSQHFTKWRIKINCDKTQAILFKFNQGFKRNPTVPLTFNGSTIALEKKVRYLGIQIDKKVNFNSHLDASRVKALNNFKASYPLLHWRSKLSTSNKLTLYKTVIRPKITYASPVRADTNQTNMNKLQTAQNKILNSWTSSKFSDSNITFYF